MVVSSSQQNSISILFGGGDGTLGERVNLSANTPPIVALGDVDNDGDLDIVMPNYYQRDSVSVVLGNGGRTFGTPMEFSTGSGPVDVALGDVNGDGNLDIATTSWESELLAGLLPQFSMLSEISRLGWS